MTTQISGSSSTPIAKIESTNDLKQQLEELSQGTSGTYVELTQKKNQDKMNKSADSLQEVIDHINFRAVLSTFKNTRVEWPSDTSDANSNQGLLRARECPTCNYYGGIIWKSPTIALSMSDKAISGYWLHQIPDDSDTVMCPMCGYEEIFEHWIAPDLLTQQKNFFDEDEYVCCLRRKAGTGREWITDLTKFHAKRGVDGIVRWCIVKPPLLTTVPNERVARQVARFLNLRYVKSTLSHRQQVKTKETMAQDAMLNI